MRFHHALQRAADVVRHVAAEFSNRQFYLIAEADLPREFHVPNAYAFTMAGLAGKIFGAAHEHVLAAVFSEHSICRDFHNEDAIVSIALHEAAHWYQQANGQSACCCFTPTNSEEQRQFHGTDFIRAAAHLSIRSLDLGFPVSIAQVLRGADPLVRNPMDYIHALFDEACPRSRALQQIMQTAPPDRFTKVWLADLKADHCRRRAEREDAEQERVCGEIALNVLAQMSGMRPTPCRRVADDLGR